MKKWQTLALSVVLVLGFTCSAIARDAKTDSKAGKPKGIAVGVVTWSATVKSIDYVKKTVVLKDESGREIPVNAKNARNLDQVIVGDKVKVKYIEELVVAVRKPEGEPHSGAVRTVALAPKGKMPGGVITETVQVQANVEDVDYGKRTITLRDSSGESRIYKVGRKIKRLKDVKKGDQVVIDVTQALALEVVKP